MGEGVELTDEQVLALLREDEREFWMAWTPEPVPPCRVCGGALSIGSIGGGAATEWGCSTSEDDPDHPGYLRTKAGRSCGDRHYGDSRWTQYRGGDSAGLEVLRRLAAERLARREAYRWAAEQFRMWDGFSPLTFADMIERGRADLAALRKQAADAQGKED